MSTNHCFVYTGKTSVAIAKRRSLSAPVGQFCNYFQTFSNYTFCLKSDKCLYKVI